MEITSEGACRSRALVKPCFGSGSLVTANSQVRLTVGRLVSLEMTPGNIVKATGWVCGVPLAGLIVAIPGSYFRLFSGHGEIVHALLSILVEFGVVE